MRNKTCGIITLFEVDNYGNRLQNYAVVSLLKKLGVDSETIAMSRRRGISHFRDIVASTRESLKRMKRHEGKRTKRFKTFSRKYTPVRHVVKNNIQSMPFDAYVIGSDQVWNPSWGIGAREDGMQCAAGIEKGRKIALSPSFGIAELSREWQQRYANWLSDFEVLSAREDSGAEIIARLTGKRPVVLVDPTMGIDASEWLSVADDSMTPRAEYVLTYYLGDKQGDLSNAVERFADDNQYSVSNLMDLDSSVHQAGPSEFLSLIANSSYFVTDSFHGCVFAILFHKDFAVVRREQAGQVDMFSRLETLLAKFSLEDRICLNGSLPEGNIDWTLVDALLKKERQKLISYLESELRRAELIE